MHPLSGSFQCRTNEGAGRAFAVRAGHMEYRGQAILRPADCLKQCNNTVEPQLIAVATLGRLARNQ
jgi:hypothetical protein